MVNYLIITCDNCIFPLFFLELTAKWYYRRKCLNTNNLIYWLFVLIRHCCLPLIVTKQTEKRHKNNTFYPVKVFFLQISIIFDGITGLILGHVYFITNFSMKFLLLCRVNILKFSPCWIFFFCLIDECSSIFTFYWAFNSLFLPTTGHLIQ